jgi:hypothetical protein
MKWFRTCPRRRHGHDLHRLNDIASHCDVSILGANYRPAALPAARIVPDITRDELIEIVRLAMTVDPQDARYYCDLFDKNVPMPGASSLIYWPEDTKDWYRRHPDGSMSDYNPTPEEIVDKATAPGRIIYL